MPPEARVTDPVPDLRAAAAAARPDAFMSYAREDVTVADALEARLAAHGKRLWLDRKDIPYSAPWRERARAGIDASKAMVFVLSASWVASDACRFEFEHAQQTGKRLIPVVTSPHLRPDTLPRALADLAWIVIVDGQLD
ncbi:MAG: toll/interleukin-1 receptor domain-containing protein, partial [Actinobacteria bacterium]|nr:toll/interleukin-1 receptor domain-containing protein [Actinomycetota bacterium]